MFSSCYVDKILDYHCQLFTNFAIWEWALNVEGCYSRCKKVEGSCILPIITKLSQAYGRDRESAKEEWGKRVQN